MIIFWLVVIVAILLVVHQVAIPLLQGLPLFSIFQVKNKKDMSGKK